MPVNNILGNHSFWKTFFSQPKYSYNSIPDLTGKVAIVTGATGHIGLATVVGLAAHGCHVFMACRNRVKAEEAIEQAHQMILQLQFDFPDALHQPSFQFHSTNEGQEDDNNRNDDKIDRTDEKGPSIAGQDQVKVNMTLADQPQQPHRHHLSPPKIEFLELELGNLDKCRQSAKEFLARGLPLHILINSAGVAFKDFEMTEDGYESHFGINHLGHFVFTTMLLDRIRESAPARVVILTSAFHELPSSYLPIDFKNLRNPSVKDHSFTMRRYGQSRLANVLFAKALARRVRNEQVFVNMVHPGCFNRSHVHEDMVLRAESNAFYNFSKVCWYLSYSDRQCALTPLYCATSPEIEKDNVRARYFIPTANELRPNPVSEIVSLQEELWAFSEKASSGNSVV